MKYLKEEKILNRKGEEITIRTPEGDEPLTTGLYSYLAMEAYIPQPQVYVIKPAQMRYFNQVLNKLDGEPKDDYWEFEDQEFDVLKNTVMQLAPLIPVLARVTYIIEEKFEATLKEKPEEVEGKKDV